MDSTTALNLNSEIKKPEQNNASETAGTVANNSPSPLFNSTSETAGSVASSSSSGSSISYNA